MAPIKIGSTSVKLPDNILKAYVGSSLVYEKDAGGTGILELSFGAALTGPSLDPEFKLSSYGDYILIVEGDVTLFRFSVTPTSYAEDASYWSVIDGVLLEDVDLCTVWGDKFYAFDTRGEIIYRYSIDPSTMALTYDNYSFALSNTYEDYFEMRVWGDKLYILSFDFPDTNIERYSISASGDLTYDGVVFTTSTMVLYSFAIINDYLFISTSPDGSSVTISRYAISALGDLTYDGYDLAVQSSYLGSMEVHNNALYILSLAGNLVRYDFVEAT